MIYVDKYGFVRDTACDDQAAKFAAQAAILRKAAAELAAENDRAEFKVLVAQHLALGKDQREAEVDAGYELDYLKNQRKGYSNE